MRLYKCYAPNSEVRLTTRVYGMRYMVARRSTTDTPLKLYPKVENNFLSEDQLQGVVNVTCRNVANTTKTAI